VEFKTPDRYSRDRRAALSVPRRDDTTPIDPLPAQISTPVDEVDTTNFAAATALPLQATTSTLGTSGGFDSLPHLPTPPQITLPPNKVVRSHVRHFLFNKITAVVAGIAIMATGGYFGAESFLTQQNSGSNSGSVSYSTKTFQDTGYLTVLPEGKSIGQLGGWQRISPPKSTPVYAYADKIDNVTVSVSEEPLPKSFVGHAADQVAALAKDYNATDQINTGDTTVYVGTSAKGPQSAILIKSDLLILIKSQSKISDKSWASYVQSLK